MYILGQPHNDPKPLKQEEMCHLQKQKISTTCTGPWHWEN